MLGRGDRGADRGPRLTATGASSRSALARGGAPRRVRGPGRKGLDKPEGRVYRALLTACAQLRQPAFTAHGLQRRVVNGLLREGVDLKVAAERMGHSPAVMLVHYRRMSQVDKAAGVSKAGLGEAPPRGASGL